MPLAILLVLFLVVPLIELAIIIQVGQSIGLVWTIVILVADSVLGSLLVRSQGRTAWRRFTEAIQAGRPPAREVMDGVLVIGGGALLLTPGFVSDLVGIALLLPPTRAVVRRIVLRRVMKRMTASLTGAAAGAPRARAYDVEGRAVEVKRP